MPRSLYPRVGVTDALAAERTFLAAERTFLAYVRTALAMFVAGLSGARLLDDPLLIRCGYALVALSLPVFSLGLWRLRRSNRSTRDALTRATEEGAHREARPET